MRTVMLVTLWLNLLAIIAAVVCSLFGVSFFYFGQEVHTQTTASNEWLFTAWLLGVVGLGFAATRVSRVRRVAALLFCWSVSIVPLLLAFVCFLESCMTSDSTFARYYRMECMVILVIGFLFEARVYYVFQKRQRNA
jgi:hypothetical protein